MRHPSRRPNGSRLRRSLLATLVLLVSALLLVPSWTPAGSRPAGALAVEEPVPVAPVPVPVPVQPVPAPIDADARIAAQLAVRAASVGPLLSGEVLDADTGAVVWSAAPDAALRPASITKLTTAVIALRTLGPTARLSTRVVAGARPGQVVLVGAGDPTLTSARLRALAAVTLRWAAASGRRSVDLVLDDRLFAPPALATGWPRSYYPGSIAPVRALQVDQRAVLDTSSAAGAVFAAALRKGHLMVRRTGRGAAPTVARTVAVSVSPPVGDMVAHMLSVSDNDYAEALLRLSAQRRGLPTTWAGVRATQQAVLAEAGIPLAGVQLFDGSGLSRADRIPASTLVALLRTVRSDPAYAIVLRADALPTAGVSGSLRPARHRFTTAPAACARGNVRAKTGILRDVVSLAGYATGSDGRVKVFAFVVNGRRSTTAAKNAVDALAATVTGCW